MHRSRSVESAVTIVGIGTTRGSSPRARGTHSDEWPLGDILRFIPAGAGNTDPDYLRVNGLTVHPRGRGEHTGFVSSFILVSGSSPRARGTLARQDGVYFPDRFIPAGAGNTLAAAARAIISEVHPRGRGEHHRYGIPRKGSDGSSPRARGTRGSSDNPLPGSRFIPAGAGNTTSRAYCVAVFIPAGAGNTAKTHQEAMARSVHPRGRGEHSSAMQLN